VDPRTVTLDNVVSSCDVCFDWSSDGYDAREVPAEVLN
jgi:hypothetical protein